jgi:cysteine desulfuration protein SufE
MYTLQVRLMQQIHNIRNNLDMQSQQFNITANLADGKVLYQGDSDALLVKGLVGLLVEGLSGLTPAEIVTITPYFIQDTG